AGTSRVRRDRRRARPHGRRQDAGGDDRGLARDGHRTRTAVRGGRELPAAQIERELPAPAGRIGGNREPDLGRARPLQRRGTRVQRQGANLSDASLRATAGLPTHAVLRSDAGRRDAAPRTVQFESEGYDEDQVASGSPLSVFPTSSAGWAQAPRPATYSHAPR